MKEKKDKKQIEALGTWNGKIYGIGIPEIEAAEPGGRLWEWTEDGWKVVKVVEPPISSLVP